MCLALSLLLFSWETARMPSSTALGQETAAPLPPIAWLPQLGHRDRDRDRDRDEVLRPRTQGAVAPRPPPPGRTMLRGKSRLNVEWLGYSPGLLLEHEPLAAARTQRSSPGNEGSLASTLKTLLFFTALMITVPIGLYFTTKSYIFEGALGMSNRDSYFYAAIVAVVAVHVVLALFVYVAWNEGSRQWREGKQD